MNISVCAVGVSLQSVVSGQRETGAATHFHNLGSLVLVSMTCGQCRSQSKLVCKDVRGSQVFRVTAVSGANPRTVCLVIITVPRVERRDIIGYDDRTLVSKVADSANIVRVDCTALIETSVFEDDY